MTTSISAEEIVKRTPFPQRKVLLEFFHPTIGDDDIADHIARAVSEFHKANPHAATWPTAFVASNGIRIRFHAPAYAPQ